MTPSAYCQNPRIVVIGAGLAGLTTAYRLHQNGLNTELYEARSRVGGRVLTAKLNGQIIELGGLSITDGGEADNFLRLVKEFDLKLSKRQVELDLAYFDGNDLVPFEDLYHSFNCENLRSRLDVLAAISQNMRDVLKGLLTEEDPLFHALSARLAAYEGGNIDHLSTLYIDTLYHMLLGGSSAAHQKTLVELVSIQGGNGQLPDMMAQKLGNRLHLDKALLRVSKTDRGSYLLTFCDGETSLADLLILAIPCPVYSDIVFDEGVLPSNKLKAIKNIAYGTNAKIIAPLASNAREVSFMNRDLLSYVDSGTLVLYYASEAGKFSAETIGETYRQSKNLVEKGLGDDCPPFEDPIYAKDLSFVDYQAPVGYSWSSDSYVKGSYSYIASGQEEVLTEFSEVQGERVKALFAPIDQKLYFVGEHTSILTEVPGTMEAACESGERIARMILKYL